MVIYIGKIIAEKCSYKFQNIKKMMDNLQIYVISFIVIAILNYIFIFIELVTVILNI